MKVNDWKAVVSARREDRVAEETFPGLGLILSTPVEFDADVVELESEPSKGDKESTAEAVAEAKARLV